MSTAVHGNFSNNTIDTPNITEILIDKLSDSFSMDLYARCRVQLETDRIIHVAPQFFTHEISAVDALNKGASIWNPATRVRRSPDVTHWSMVNHAVLQSAAVGDAVDAKSDYSGEKHRTDFEILMENTKFNLSAKMLTGFNQLWT